MAEKPNKTLSDKKSKALETYRKFNIETMTREDYGVWIEDMTKYVLGYNVAKAMLNPNLK